MSDRSGNTDFPQCHIPAFNTLTSSSTLSSERPSMTTVSPLLASSEPSAEPSTLQLMLAARQAAEEAQAAVAAAAAASQTDVASRRLAGNTPLKLPYLREPNKEANPSDLDIAIRLGAFLARGNDESFLRLLQKEFPEPSMMPGRVQDYPLSRLDLPCSALTATVFVSRRGPGRCRDGVTAPSYGNTGVNTRCRTGRRSLLQLETGAHLVTALDGQRDVTQSETVPRLCASY